MESNKEVIIIDDDQVFQLILKVQISTVAPEVAISGFMNGKLALDHLLSRDLKEMNGLILLDLNMSVMDGWELLDKLGQELPRIGDRMKIYIVSSSIDPLDIKRSREYDLVSGFLSKPLEVKVLQKLLLE